MAESTSRHRTQAYRPAQAQASGLSKTTSGALAGLQRKAAQSRPVARLALLQSRAKGTASARTQESDAPLQRFLDDEDYMEEVEEEFDSFMEHLGYDDEALFSEDDWTYLVAEHAALRVLDRQEPAERPESLSDRFYAFWDWLAEHYLEPGSAAWNDAVWAAVDYLDRPEETTFQQAALAEWPGKEDPPDTFAPAIEAEVAKRAQQAAEAEAELEAGAARARAAEVLAIAAEYQAWRGRLLPGTLNTIRRLLAGDTLATVQQNLQAVYEFQTKPSHQNWLIHLDIAGNKIVGTGVLHYTTFNNSVTVDTVDLAADDAATTMGKLFGRAPQGRQLHASRKNALPYYRRYYNGVYYRQNVEGVAGAACAAPGGVIQEQLDATHAKMLADMRAKVDSALANHGRIGHNQNARQLSEAKLTEIMGL